MSVEWNSDQELFDLASAELFPALLGDAMDKMGLLHQFLPAQVRPVQSPIFVIGKAMTPLASGKGLVLVLVQPQ